MFYSEKKHLSLSLSYRFKQTLGSFGSLPPFSVLCASSLISQSDACMLFEDLYHKDILWSYSLGQCSADIFKPNAPKRSLYFNSKVGYTVSWWVLSFSVLELLSDLLDTFPFRLAAMRSTEMQIPLLHWIFASFLLVWAVGEVAERADQTWTSLGAWTPFVPLACTNTVPSGSIRKHKRRKRWCGYI